MARAVPTESVLGSFAAHLARLDVEDPVGEIVLKVRAAIEQRDAPRARRSASVGSRLR